MLWLPLVVVRVVVLVRELAPVVVQEEGVRLAAEPAARRRVRMRMRMRCTRVRM